MVTRLVYGVKGSTHTVIIDTNVTYRVMRKHMYKFINEMREKGYDLGDIVFTWGPVPTISVFSIGNVMSSFVNRKMEK